MLYDLYWNKHMSSNQITQMFDMPYNSILSYFKLFGISIKSCKEATAENIKYNRLTLKNHFSTKFISHITWYNKEIILRSKNELEYASELDS